MAIKQMREQIEMEKSGDMGRSQDITPTPERNMEKELKIQISQLKAAYQQVEYSCCVPYYMIYYNVTRLLKT